MLFTGASALTLTPGLRFSPFSSLLGKCTPCPNQPVPLGPCLTLGSFPPKAVNLCGSLRYSTISSSSDLASSTPFTSSNLAQPHHHKHGGEQLKHSKPELACKWVPSKVCSAHSLLC